MAALDVRTVLYVWGRNSHGQCGEINDDYQPTGKPTIAMPRAIELPLSVTAIACGTGQQGCTFAVLEDGSLYTFGNNYGGRLGHPKHSTKSGHLTYCSKPRRVEALENVRVVAACCSNSHAMCLTDDGIVYSWGMQGHTGCLGRIDIQPKEHALPGVVKLPDAATHIDCESGVSAAVVSGCLLIWGSDMVDRNPTFRLGLHNKEKKKGVVTVREPTHVPMPDECGAVRAISLGSLYSAAICDLLAAKDQTCICTWGYGGHGNLGHGDRHSQPRPKRVLGESGSSFAAETAMRAVACTRGQEGLKGGLYPRANGTEISQHEGRGT